MSRKLAGAGGVGDDEADTWGETKQEGGEVRHFTISGPPRGKGRARSTRGGIHYTDKKTRMYESHVLDSYLRVYPDADPLTGPVQIEIAAYIQRPKNHYRTGAHADKLKDSAPQFPAVTPDIDNILKSILDGLNKIAFIDDKQVVSIVAHKFYAISVPCVIVDLGDMIPLTPPQSL